MADDVDMRWHRKVPEFASWESAGRFPKENEVRDTASRIKEDNTQLRIKAHEIAGKAAELVGGDRDRQHGSKADNFTRIAMMWNAYLGVRRDPASPLDAVDVGHLMALMKVARTQSGAVNADDFIDGCGYMACAGEIALNGG